MGVIFVDELACLVMGMWLARHGTWVEAIAAAAGGTVAAAVVMLFKRGE
jgi:hypothetical protein